MSVVIKIENLSKQYLIQSHERQQHYIAIRDVISNGMRTLFRPKSTPKPFNAFAKEIYWALKDVNLEINQGDRVGIIGRNGAGKSTLLKILSRITEPTKGRISIQGRIASLLEVGTGFHPELTGRENIFLNGAIIGMSRADIKKQFDEIVAFAEVEKFLDTPVKHYSSGMYVRLAFAVAAHLEPDILILDEVLAVGDSQFQKKCLGKMEEVSKEGRTVVFVSHNLPAVGRLCNLGICLEKGTIRIKGEIARVLEYYQCPDPGEGIYEDRSSEIRDGEAKIVKWHLVNSDTGLAYSCFSRELCEIRFVVVSKKDVSKMYLGFAIWNMDGTLVLAGSSLDNEGQYFDMSFGVYHVIAKVRLPLKEGNYQLDISLNGVDIGQFDRWTGAPKLRVLPKKSTNLPEIWHGILNEDVQFKLEKI